MRRRRDRGPRRYLVVAAALSLLAVAALASGCVFSDAITERIYDTEESSTIDHDSDPLLVNSINADQTSDRLPKLDDDPHTEVESDTVLTLATYTDDPSLANTDKPAARPELNPMLEEMGAAADHSSEDSQSNQEQGSNPSDVNASTGAQRRSGDGESPAPDGTGDSDDDSQGDGDDDDGDDDPGDGDGARQSGGTGSVFTNDPNAEEPEIPDNIDEVAAVGNAAVIVSMVSGKGEATSLLACDVDTQSKMSGILANKGINSAATVWANDGTSEGDLSAEGFDRLVNEIVPDLVFVTEGSSTLSADQMVVLEEKNIDVYYLPRLVSANRIRFAVKAVGQTLAKGGVEGAENNYKAYLDYHDGLVRQYSQSNGGMTGGYDFDADRSTSASPETMVTLYLDKWDDSARLSSSTFLDTSQGVGVSTLGYTHSPIDYYLSAGGVLNNAVSSKIRQYSTSGAGIVWQFAQNELNYSFSKWNGLRAATFDLASSIKGGVYTSDLMWYSETDATGFGLGTEAFPALVVKSGELRDKVKSVAGGSGGIYYSYPTITPADKGSTVGFFSGDSEKSYVEACIGREGDASTMSGRMFTMYVNPKGLAQSSSADDLCSWTSGSLESVLEASWAHYRFRGGSQSAFWGDVKDFYQKFYDYPLDEKDLKAIEVGAAL